MADYQIRTIKLKLILSAKDKVEKEAAWTRIHQILNDAWRAANWVISGQAINDQLIRRVYARKKIDPKNLEDVSEVEAALFSKDGFMGTKRQATTERDMKAEFPSLPSCVSNTLNQIVVSSYNNEKSDVMMGRRSLRTYRQGMPVPIAKRAIVIEPGEKEYVIIWKLNRVEQIRFDIFFGRDRANNRLTIHRIVDGANDYGSPSLKYKDKSLYLLLPVKEPVKNMELDPGKAIGVNLGIIVPAYVVADNGLARRSIGSASDFFRVRRAMQDRFRRLQSALALVNGGKGRKKKLRAMERLKEKEKNFARQYNHAISKAIVDFAVKHRCGMIKLELLEGYGDDHKNDLLLRNWSYFELHSHVQYKAKRVGAAVVFTDPYRISQTCSSCGHYAEGQKRSATKFECENCGAQLDANYNAALNNARSKKIVTKKEECEYHAKFNKPAGPTAAG